MVLRLPTVFVMLGAPLGQLLACSCDAPAPVCNSVGQAAAVFTGRVLAVSNEPSPGVPLRRAGDFGGRLTGNPGGRVGEPGFRLVRFRVLEALSGVAEGASEAEIVTGFGSGDCGYDFRVGVEYVVYAGKNARGRLATGICSRTRPLAAAAEDLAYIRKMASMPPTSELRVRTGFPDSPGPAGVTVRVEGPGAGYLEKTNGAGIATFHEVSAGEYVIHQDSDGRLRDDPQVVIYPKGCVETILLRKLRLQGRVTTRAGEPAAQSR